MKTKQPAPDKAGNKTFEFSLYELENITYALVDNRLYAQLTSAFCKTDRIASGSGLLYVLHFCGYTQGNLKGVSKRLA